MTPSTIGKWDFWVSLKSQSLFATMKKKEPAKHYGPMMGFRGRKNQHEQIKLIEYFAVESIKKFVAITMTQIIEK